MLEVRIKKKLPSFSLDVSFSMDNGILSIMGPSGSGKTLTLQCIAGLVRPDEGYIKLNGRVLYDSSNGTNLPARVRRAGFVFQNYALFTHLSVRENIAYGMHDASKGDRDRKVTDLLARMKIERLGDRYPRQLSSGEQQRVALARALASEPEVLLLDEPFSALDILNKEGLELELLSVQRSFGGSTLFVTHDSSQGYSLGSRIAVYGSGHIIQCDARSKVISSPANCAVARLMGLKNLLNGQISRLTNTDVYVALPGLGGELRALLNKDLPLTIGQRVTVGIQPERVSVAVSAGENALPGVVDHVVEGIGGVNYFFRLAAGAADGDYLLASSPRPSPSSVREGHACYMHFPPENVVVIADTGPSGAPEEAHALSGSVGVGQHAKKALDRQVGAFALDR